MIYDVVTLRLYCYVFSKNGRLLNIINKRYNDVHSNVIVTTDNLYNFTEDKFEGYFSNSNIVLYYVQIKKPKLEPLTFVFNHKSSATLEEGKKLVCFIDKNTGELQVGNLHTQQNNNTNHSQYYFVTLSTKDNTLQLEVYNG